MSEDHFLQECPTDPTVNLIHSHTKRQELEPSEREPEIKRKMIYLVVLF